MKRISNCILDCGSAVRPFYMQGFGFKGLFLGLAGGVALASWIDRSGIRTQKKSF